MQRSMMQVVAAAALTATAFGAAAQKHPEKLKELQAVFMKEADRNNVLTIDDRRAERFVPAIAGRPDLLGDCRL